MMNQGVEKVFWTDPYATMLDTRVASVDGGAITVERTIFFAFCGWPRER